MSMSYTEALLGRVELAFRNAHSIIGNHSIFQSIVPVKISSIDYSEARLGLVKFADVICLKPVSIGLKQWFPTFFDWGPLLVCWRAWGATM